MSTQKKQHNLDLSGSWCILLSSKTVVPGKTKSHTFKGYKTEHTSPVYNTTLVLWARFTVLEKTTPFAANIVHGIYDVNCDAMV